MAIRVRSDVRDLIRNAYEHGCKDVDANYDPDDADPDFSEAAYDYAESVTDDFINLFPSIASPVQPVLEWRESTLFFNGGKIGSVKIATAFDWTCTDGPPWAYAGIWSKMYTQVDTEDQGRAMLENEARQWLSGGDK